MILASDSLQTGQSFETKLLLPKSEMGGTYVKSLYLGDSGVVLNYGAPKAGKLTRVSPPQPASTVASVSGAH